MSVARILGLAVCFAVATAFVGWWSVPVVALVWGAVAARRGNDRVAMSAAAGAALGWLALLAFDAMRGAVVPLAAALAGIMRLPAPVLVVVTLAFPALLAWGAAAFAAILAPPRTDRA